VQPGEIISAAAYNALVDAINPLLSMSGSYPIEVRRHAAGVHVSLAYADKDAHVELTSELHSGGSATAKILHFDGDQWQDGETDSIDVHDVIGSMEGNVGDKALVRFHRQSGMWIVWQLQC
jgi:hypothetical protein